MNASVVSSAAPARVSAKILCFGAGLLFAVGLAVSGMTDPSKVRAFLDVSGVWDPSLAFVMVGAIGVHASLARLILKRSAPLFASSFEVLAKQIDARLLAGSAIFGIGWGIAGYCPGPAIASVVGGSLSGVLFVVAMVVGVLLSRAVDEGRAASQPDSCS